MASIDKTKSPVEELALDSADPKQTKILPAKLLKRISPLYPKKASQRNIEGWVELSFKIDTDGKPANIAVLASEPKGVFEKEAMRSVKKWRFEPAYNEETKLPVAAHVESTRVTFRLE